MVRQAQRTASSTTIKNENLNMAMTKRLWSVSALAVELDADRRTVANALKRVPADGEQGGHQAWFILTAIRAMWPAPDANGEILDPAQERARKDRALAVQAEIRNDLVLGNVVLVDDVVMAFTSMATVARSHFLALPSKLSQIVPSQLRHEVFDKSQELIYDALNEYANTDIVPIKEARKKQAKRASREIEHDHGQRREAPKRPERSDRKPRTGRDPDKNGRASAQPSDRPRAETL